MRFLLVGRLDDSHRTPGRPAPHLSLPIAVDLILASRLSALYCLRLEGIGSKRYKYASNDINHKGAASHPIDSITIFQRLPLTMVSVCPIVGPLPRHYIYIKRQRPHTLVARSPGARREARELRL